MKDKLVKLYKSIINSEKNLITYNRNSNRDFDDIFDIIHKSEFGESNRTIADEGLCSLKLHSKTVIAVGETNNLYTTKTFTEGLIYDNNFYRENLDEYYNGHEIEECEVVDFPLEKIYGVGISFYGQAPNLLLYMTYKRTKLSEEEVILDRTKYTLWGTRLTTLKFDIEKLYYLKFGSVYEKISEKEYVKLVNLAIDYKDESTENIVDILSKEYIK